MLVLFCHLFSIILSMESVRIQLLLLSMESVELLQPNLVEIYIGAHVTEFAQGLPKHRVGPACPHAHQQNGSAERKHRHIVEVGLSLLAHASTPLKYWDEPFITATYLINRLPSKVIGNSTPLELLYHQKPDYNSLKTFGCACYPNLRPYNHHKL